VQGEQNDDTGELERLRAEVQQLRAQRDNAAVLARQLAGIINDPDVTDVVGWRLANTPPVRAWQSRPGSTADPAEAARWRAEGRRQVIVELDRHLQSPQWSGKFRLGLRYVQALLRSWEVVDPQPAPAQPAGEARPDRLGRLVRAVWVGWAQEQPNPKPGHLAGWDDLDDGQREVDRRIGLALAAAGHAEVDNATSWGTRCVGCAALLDQLTDEYARGEKAGVEVTLAATRTVLDAYMQHQNGLIRLHEATGKPVDHLVRNRQVARVLLGVLVHYVRHGNRAQIIKWLPGTSRVGPQ
jgi:hypothetical protein